MKTLNSHELREIIRSSARALEKLSEIGGDAYTPVNGDETSRLDFRGFPRAIDAPASASVLAIDGGGIVPLLVHEGRALHATFVALVRFETAAGRRGVRRTGEWLRSFVHEVAVARRGPLSGASGLVPSDLLNELERDAAFGADPHLPDDSNHAAWGSILRAGAEWGLALRAVEDAPPGSIVLLDASFAPAKGRSWARRALRRLQQECIARASDRHVRLVAVSKGSGLGGLYVLAMRLEDYSVPDPCCARSSAEGLRCYWVRFFRVMLRIEVPDVGNAEEDVELLRALDHLSLCDSSPGYPYPLRAAHVAVTADGKAREAVVAAITPELDRLGIPREALLDAGRRSGHAPR